MDYSRKIAERHWNLPDKGKSESKREDTFIDDIVQKAHIEKAILESLDGVETVFDGGAGTGRFSILLAGLGKKVTHFDISQPMIDTARKLAAEAGVEQNMTFVRGALEDLGAFADKSFDLVLSVDAPVSYTYPNQENVIANLVRITRKRILLSVSSRLGTLPYFANPVHNKLQFILDKDSGDRYVQWIQNHAYDQVPGFHFNKDLLDEIWDTCLCPGVGESIAEFDKGGAPWPITYLFLPDELEAILQKSGVRNIRMAGPGAFARMFPQEILASIMRDAKQRADFLDFCYRYDSNPYVCGMGKDNLVAIGEVQSEL